MATEILPAQQGNGQLFHQPRPRRSSPSSSSLFLAGSTPPLSSSPKPTSYANRTEHNERIPSTPPISSLDSSPRASSLDLSKTSSYTPTLMSSGLSLEASLRSRDDLDFPNYDSLSFSHSDEGYDSSHRRNEEDSEAPEISTSTSTTMDDSPLATPTIVDDTAIKQEPSRHVDYLSHNWREEDIWSSWRHIVSQRKYYGPKSRLENASWRTWAKSKYRLRTVSPEKLNWYVSTLYQHSLSINASNMSCIGSKNPTSHGCMAR